MEDKKNPRLDDLKKQLQNETLTQSDSIKVTGGKTVEKDRWQTGCGDNPPQ